MNNEKKDALLSNACKLDDQGARLKFILCSLDSKRAHSETMDQDEVEGLHNLLDDIYNSLCSIASEMDDGGQGHE